MEHFYFVYILTNKSKTVLYVGVTNDLIRRMEQHHEKSVPGFTSRYNLTILIYFESFLQITDALQREKQLKGWRRQKKETLIARENPAWDELPAP